MVKKLDRKAKAQLSRRYSDLIDQLRHLLTTRDPVGLIALGAPDDEYDSEVSAIAARLRECTTVEGALQVTSEVFNRSFERSDEKSYYLPLAEEVTELARNFWRSDAANREL